MTEHSEDIIFNENTCPDAEQAFRELCQRTQEKNKDVPPHIINLALRTHRVNQLKAQLQEQIPQSNIFQVTLNKAKNLARGAAKLKALTVSDKLCYENHYEDFQPVKANASGKAMMPTYLIGQVK